VETAQNASKRKGRDSNPGDRSRGLTVFKTVIFGSTKPKIGDLRHFRASPGDFLLEGLRREPVRWMRSSVGSAMGPKVERRVQGTYRNRTRDLLLAKSAVQDAVGDHSQCGTLRIGWSSSSLSAHEFC
jgi:hypothetical protein